MFISRLQQKFSAPILLLIAIVINIVVLVAVAVATAVVIMACWYAALHQY